MIQTMDRRKRQIKGRWGRGKGKGEKGEGKRGRGSLPYIKDGGARRNYGKKPPIGQICSEMQVNEVQTLLLYDKHLS